MQVHRVDAADYDEALAAHVEAVVNPAWAVDCPHEPPLSARGHLLRLRHGWDGFGPDVVFCASADDKNPVGVVSVETSHWQDNQHLAWLDLTVHPRARRRGIGGTLLSVAERWACEAGKTLVGGTSWAAPAAEAFARAHGYEPALREVERRLDLQTLDWDHIDKLHEEAARAAADYELVRLVGPTPADMVPELIAVTAAINDAPLGTLDVEDDVYSPQRLRAFDRAQLARGHVVYRLLARRLSDGDWAGQTLVAVDRSRAGYGDQLDTAVVRAHRGHRLGLLLKTEMLRWLREREPQLTTIDTWNAESNQHMIAINDRLGCRVVGHSIEWQRHL